MKKSIFCLMKLQKWQIGKKLINGLRIAYDCDIFITKSNANMRSGELATYLSLRYVEIKVYPLLLDEFSNFSSEKSLDNYLENILSMEDSRQLS